MKTSEKIDNISKAIVKCQSSIGAASKNGKNTFFKVNGNDGAKYATLDSILEAIKEPLKQCDLAILQAPVFEDGRHSVITRILHSTGEFIEITTPLLLNKQDMQALGSAITYAKRYALGSMLAVPTEEDDDGNAATGKQTNNKSNVKNEVLNTSDYVIKTTGSAKGKKLSELSLDAIQKNINYWQNRAKTENTDLKGTVKEDVEASIKYLAEKAELMEIK